jgi:hypothetical protein
MVVLSQQRLPIEISAPSDVQNKTSKTSVSLLKQEEISQLSKAHQNRMRPNGKGTNRMTTAAARLTVPRITQKEQQSRWLA